jgi:hypothetical protein
VAGPQKSDIPFNLESQGLLVKVRHFANENSVVGLSLFSLRQMILCVHAPPETLKRRDKPAE